MEGFEAAGWPNMLANHLELWEMPHIAISRAPFLESPTICTRPG